MVLGQRGRVILPNVMTNQKMGGVFGKGKVIPNFKTNGERLHGIPTVSDRVTQMVVKLHFEPTVEPFFHEDSYGYRPRK
jgi:hypothetical protein